MIHIALCYTKISAGLDQEEKDIMMTGSMIDRNGLQNLEKSGIGKSEREERIEYGN